MANHVKKQKKAINRKTKTILVWDDQSRQDYLTGFRKRKAERKKYHVEKVKKRMIEERKEIRRQTREIRKQLVHSKGGQQCEVPEVEHLIDATEFDLPNHTVTITDIADVDFASEGGLRLGQNMVGNDEEDTDKKKQNETNNTDKPKEKKLASLKKKLNKVGKPDYHKKRKRKDKHDKHDKHSHNSKHNSKGGRFKDKKSFKKRKMK